MPAALMIGTDGPIMLKYANPKFRVVRLNPDVLLAAVKAALE